MVRSFMVAKSESGEVLINLAEITYAAATSPHETTIHFTDGRRLLLHKPLSEVIARVPVVHD